LGITFFSKISLISASRDVEAGVAVGAQKAHHQRLDGGMGGPVGIGRHAGIDDVHAGFDGLEMGHGDMPEVKWLCRWMGGLTACLEGLDDFIGVVGGDQAGHVLDADGIGAHGLQVFGLVDVVVQVVDLAAQARFGHGVADAALEVLAVLLDLGHDGLKVAVVVQGVEGAEDVHAVFTGAVHEGIGHIVGIVAVAHQVLGAQQHGKGVFLK
jgi:hypothetical protein